MPCSENHFVPILDELRQREEQNINDCLHSSAPNQRTSEPVLSRPSGRVEGANKGWWGGPRVVANQRCSSFILELSRSSTPQNCQTNLICQVRYCPLR